MQQLRHAESGNQRTIKNQSSVVVVSDVMEEVVNSYALISIEMKPTLLGNITDGARKAVVGSNQDVVSTVDKLNDSSGINKSSEFCAQVNL
jgi:hypothetical protein